LKKYEAIFILDEHLADEQGKVFAEEITKFIVSQGGSMLESLPMGRKQFAYPVKKRKTGVYWNFIFEIPEDKVNSVKSNYRLDEKVLRSRIYEYSKPEKTEAVAEALV
jgi:small subunit ribosomal protein S6